MLSGFWAWPSAKTPREVSSRSEVNIKIVAQANASKTHLPLEKAAIFLYFQVHFWKHICMTINAKRNTNNPLVSFYTMISAFVKKFGCFDKCTSVGDQITASFELKKKQNKVSSQDYALWGFKNFPGNGCLTWRLPGVWCQCNPCIFALITLPLHNTCLTYSGNWTNLYEPNVKPQRQNIFTNLYFKVSLSRMNFMSWLCD